MFRGFSRPLELLAVAGVISIAVTAVVPPASAQETFAGFIVGLRDVCATAPARACTKQVSSFLDGDNDSQVSLREIQDVRARAKSTVKRRDSGLSTIERNLISIGLLALPHANLATIFGRFDADADGGLSEAELFADFELDQRPLDRIISDPDGVDWQAFAARFGKIGFLVLDLLPPSHRK